MGITKVTVSKVVGIGSKAEVRGWTALEERVGIDPFGKLRELPPTDGRASIFFVK